MGLTPTHFFQVELCDCYDSDSRKHVGVFYKREDNRIKCTQCDNVPPELSVQHVPKSHRVEIDIIHHLDERTTRQHKQVIYPE